MNTRKTPDSESIRLELQEALGTFRHWTTQTIQAASVAATADALLITYGFSQRLGGILFLASFIPFAMLLLFLQIMSAAASIINIAIRLERKLSIRTESLAATYAEIHMRPLVSKIASMADLGDKELLDLDRKLSKKYWLRKQIPLALCAATIGQIGLAIISLAVYHYKFM